MVAEAFSPARGHQNECVAPCGHTLNHVFLKTAERLQTENFFENLLRGLITINHNNSEIFHSPQNFMRGFTSFRTNAATAFLNSRRYLSFDNTPPAAL